MRKDGCTKMRKWEKTGFWNLDKVPLLALKKDLANQPTFSIYGFNRNVNLSSILHHQHGHYRNQSGVHHFVVKLGQNDHSHSTTLFPEQIHWSAEPILPLRARWNGRGIPWCSGSGTINCKSYPFIESNRTVGTSGKGRKIRDVHSLFDSIYFVDDCLLCGMNK